MNSQAMPVLSVWGLKKIRKQKKLLESLYLDIFPGEVVFLLSTDTAGTGCLLNIIAGNSSPNAGDVYLNAKKITNDWISQSKLLYIPKAGRPYRLGRVGQRISLWQNKSGQSAGIDPLGITGLKEDEGKRCIRLSTGARQNFSMAHALALLPKLLLIDASLDDLPADERAKILQSLTKAAHLTGMTVLYVTRHGEESLSFGDRTAILSQGRIFQTDRPQAVYNHPLSADAASLTGECLLLKGIATAAEDETIMMAMDGLDLTCYSSMWISPGDPLLLCLRPDLIYWDQHVDKAGPNTFLANLKEAKREGEDIRLCFELRNGIQLNFSRNNPPSKSIRINQEYRLWFDTKLCPIILDSNILTKDQA